MYRVHIELITGKTTTVANALDKADAEATAKRMLTLFAGKVVRTWIEPVDA